MTNSYRTSEVCDTRAQAIERGARFYWGRDCEHGHGDGEHVKRYAGNNSCVECERLVAKDEHPARKGMRAARRKSDLRRRWGEDHGKRALDDYLRQQDTGDVREVWDE